MNYKHFLYSSGVILTFGLYAYFDQTTVQLPPLAPAVAVVPKADVAPSVPVPVVVMPAQPPAPAPKPTPAPQPVPTIPIKPKGLYADGQYVGSVADAYYGNVQVQVSVSGGRISNVAFLQYPNDRGHSVKLNQYAMPILSSEAIAAQSANVDAVSGASDTSQAFQQSLASALAKAKN